MGHRGIITAERLTTVDENAVALIGLDARIQQMDQMLDRLLSDDDLAGPAVQALQIVETAGRRGLRQCALAESVSLPAGTVSRLVDTLVKGDLVSRRPHPTDRRVTMLALTAAGGRRLDRRRADYGRLAEALTPQAAEALRVVNPLLDLIAGTLARSAKSKAA